MILMKTLEYYDASYSPNERAEMSHNEPDCGACEDTGTIDNQVYCDCSSGNARRDFDEVSPIGLG